MHLSLVGDRLSGKLKMQINSKWCWARRLVDVVLARKRGDIRPCLKLISF